MDQHAKLLVYIVLKVVQAQYYFQNAEDQKICENADFVGVSPYRTVSLTQMSWQSAHACCKMKGSLLHTIERSVESIEYPLQKVLPERLGMEAEDLQFWIGLSFHQDYFQWSFGTAFPLDYQRVNRELYRWVDGYPDRSPTTRCVAMSPYEDVLEMRTVSCNLKLNFICQKVERVGGEPISALDMMVVGSTEFVEVPGFDNLKFSSVFTRWPVANAICQSRNWALIDRVHERYGDELAKAIEKSNYMFYENKRVFHTSGNNFCENRVWQWVCGERLLGNIPWSQNNTNVTHPQGTLKDAGNCLQYILQPAMSDQSDAYDSTFIANVVSCNDFGYTICDMTPSCSVNDQYRCLHKDPHFIDVDASTKVEKETCKTSKFQELKADHNEPGGSYWVSSTKFSWLGANTCCKSRGWRSAAPKSTEELESLAVRLRESILMLCETEEMCGGFWTSTSTRDYLPHSPLRFQNGKLLSRSLYSLIRADAFTYPSCGRINFMNLQKSQAKYVHADCLESNFVLCEEAEDENHSIKGRQTSDEFGGGVSEFEKSVFKKFFVPLTEEDLQRQKRNYSRDFCAAVDIHSQYSENCPYSAIKIDSSSKIPSDTPTTAKIAISFQNQKILLEELVNSAFYENYETGDMQGYAFQFLNYSVMLFSKLCPIVPRSLLDNSFNMFRIMHLMLNPKRKPEMMTKVNFDWAMKLLGVCDEFSKPVYIKHDNCGDLMVGESSCSNFVCTDPKHEFNLSTTDLLLDVIWKVFEAIHAVCFPAFKQNPMLHHKYAMVITDLWESEEVQLRWTYQLEDKEFWKRLLGPNFEIHLLNLERCNTAAITNSYFHVRLPRISVPRTVRMKGFSYEALQLDIDS